MIGLLYLLFFGIYLWLSVKAVKLVARWAKTHAYQGQNYYFWYLTLKGILYMADVTEQATGFPATPVEFQDLSGGPVLRNHVPTTASLHHTRYVFGTNTGEEIGGSDQVDRLYGGDGADQLAGAEINDWLEGGSGNDSLSDDAGDDHMDDQAGAVRLTLSPSELFLNPWTCLEWKGRENLRAREMQRDPRVVPGGNDDLSPVTSGGASLAA